MLSYCRRVGKWFTVPVIEHFADDRPFRLRRLSALMLMLGWALFAVACVLNVMTLQIVAATLFTSGLFSVGIYDRRDHRRKPARRGL